MVKTDERKLVKMFTLTTFVVTLVFVEHAGGTINEVRVYNRDLSKEEIRAVPSVEWTFMVYLDADNNILDIAMVTKAYGSYPGHSRWNPSADLENIIIIYILDIAKAARNYGKEDC